MVKIWIFLGFSIIVCGASSRLVSKHKRSLFEDIKLVPHAISTNYGYGYPWSRSRNPWKTLKISSDLYQLSSGISYGTVRPSPVIHSSPPPIVLTRHVIVEKQVPVPSQPIVVEKPVHVPIHVPVHIPVEKIVPITIEKSVPIPVPQIIPYPVERAVPIRQGIPIFIANQGLLLGAGTSGTTSASPPPALTTTTTTTIPNQLLRQQLNPIQLQLPQQIQPIQIQPIQIHPQQQQQSFQQSPQSASTLQPINLSVTAGVSSGIPVQMQLPNNQMTRGVIQGLESGIAQLSTLNVDPENIQRNSLSDIEELFVDDWKLD